MGASKTHHACPSGKRRVQCKACPWRKDVVPDRDIPGGYEARKHKALRETIARPGNLRGMFGGEMKLMACHESNPGAEIVCVGWLGPGSNIALRMRAIQGDFPEFELRGEQHETFEDTLPKQRRKSR